MSHNKCSSKPVVSPLARQVRGSMVTATVVAYFSCLIFCKITHIRKMESLSALLTLIFIGSPIEVVLSPIPVCACKAKFVAYTGKEMREVALSYGCPVGAK